MRTLSIPIDHLNVRELSPHCEYALAAIFGQDPRERIVSAAADQRALFIGLVACRFDLETEIIVVIQASHQRRIVAVGYAHVVKTLADAGKCVLALDTKMIFDTRGFRC